MERPRTEQYKSQLEIGLEFQDRVADVLYDDGLPIVNYVSKERSKRSENKARMEIKRDAKFRETKQLYIEIAEKSHPDNEHFVPSGINGDSRFFTIGDEGVFWVFATKRLRAFDKKKEPNGEDRYEHKETATSKGYVLPVKHADRYCVMRYVIRDGKFTVSIGAEDDC